PTYNRAKYINEAIDSVLCQTFINFEILIVDDGSTDDTGLRIRKAYATDQRVRYYYKENEERGAARNFGLAKSSGAYAVFFDSDDWMKQDYLQDLYNLITTVQPQPHMLAVKYLFRNEKGKEWSSTMEKVQGGWYGIDAFLNGNMLACNYCVRIHDSIKPFPPERDLASMEDWLFLLENLQDRRIYIGESIGVIMREHSGRSVMNNQKVIRARIKATEWALKNLSLTDRQKRKLKGYSYYFCGVHEYIDRNKGASIKEAMRAIRWGGLQLPFIILIVKALIGKKWIEYIK
ncbi:MAG: glycosyltransferase family 2 protein, partial [Cytophagaceae bacterium]